MGVEQELIHDKHRCKFINKILANAMQILPGTHRPTILGNTTEEEVEVSAGAGHSLTDSVF